MRFLIWLLSLCFSLVISGQQFGGYPSREHWKQIHTNSARVLFPPGLDSIAKRTAAMIAILAADRPFQLGTRTRPIDIILRHRSVIPNAFVQLGPYRSEWMLRPDLNNFSNGGTGWVDLLALHEYRHVEQVENFKQGLSKTMLRLLGESAYDLAINAAIPDWFFEGDAVWQETVLSNQGRGRLPQFMNVFPALWQAQKKYSWMKIRNGSYRDKLPNHYELGYRMINYGVAQFGRNFWPQVTKEAASYHKLFYPFQSAVRKASGLRYADFANRALHGKEGFNANDISSAGTAVLPVNMHYEDNASFPFIAGRDSVIYTRSSNQELPAFYMWDSTGEHRIRVRDISLDEMFSYKNGMIVYAAYEKDPRWGWISYSSLRLLDTRTGIQQDLTNKTSYFSPDISADGKRVIALHLDENGKSALHLIDVDNGTVSEKIVSSSGYLLTDPKFIDDQFVVAAARRKDGQMALIKLGNKQEELLTPFTNYSVGFLQVQNGWVYFTGGFSGQDDIYACNLNDHRVFQVVKGGFGKYQVNASQDQLVWSEQFASGYQLRQMPLDTTKWTLYEVGALANQHSFTVALASAVRDSSNWNTSLSISDTKVPASETYRKGSRPFNFYSWRPLFEDPYYKYMLEGENLLGNFRTELYYQYKGTDRTHGVGFNALYGGKYPYLILGSEYLFDQQATVRNAIWHWSQLDSRVGLLLPFSYIKGRAIRELSLYSNYAVLSDFYKGKLRDTIGVRTLQYLSHGLRFAMRTSQAKQHIFPRLGFSVNLGFKHSISKFRGEQFNGAASVYLPGMTRNHHLVLAAAWQELDTLRQIRFGDQFPYSRGYWGEYFTRVWKLGATYHFPICYPDAGLFNMAYLLRIRSALFYDHTVGYSRNRMLKLPQRSAGAEFYFDTKWWNQHPVSLGFRITRLLDMDRYFPHKAWVAEFILPLSL